MIQPNAIAPRSYVQSFFLLPCIRGHWFTIRMDHDSLTWILSLTEFTRWPTLRRLRRSDFDFEIVHCGSIEQQAVDALAWLATNRENTTPLKNDILLLGIDAHTSKDTWMNDDNLTSLLLFQPSELTEYRCAKVRDTHCCLGHAQVGNNNSGFSNNTDHLFFWRLRDDKAL